MNNLLRHTLATMAAKRGAAAQAPVRPMGTKGFGSRPVPVSSR